MSRNKHGRPAPTRNRTDNHRPGSFTTHPCPGCGVPTPGSRFACKTCWFALPFPLRNDIDHGYRWNRNLWRDSTEKARQFYESRRQSP